LTRGAAGATLPEDHVSLWTAILIAFGLAMDAFAVSIASGLAIPKVTGRHVFRMAFHFGLFQALMPIVGWFVGASVARHLAAWDHWIAMALLGFIGGKMLYEAIRGEAETSCADPTRGARLVTLSIATSIDALAVGLSLAMLGVSVWQPALVIGVITAALSTVGILFGSRLGCHWGTRAQVAGGLVLIAIGVRIVVSHIASGT
jgi:putative Mn2+ efflux pump MntP